MGDLIARMPATRDKATNQKLLQAAVTWYEGAANAGIPAGQFKLANAYLAGMGVKRDPQQAQQWYARAAAQGMPEAQQALGLFLIAGAAGTADPVEGYKWLVLAERGGALDGQNIREKAGTKVNEQGRKQAEALAEKFTAKLERTPGDSAPRLGPPPKQ
jgi:hypothetical protein